MDPAAIAATAASASPKEESRRGALGLDGSSSSPVPVLGACAGHLEEHAVRRSVKDAARSVGALFLVSSSSSSSSSLLLLLSVVVGW